MQRKSERIAFDTNVSPEAEKRKSCHIKATGDDLLVRRLSGCQDMLCARRLRFAGRLVFHPKASPAGRGVMWEPQDRAIGEARSGSEARLTRLVPR
jgi:hypothetical protein